MITKIVGDAEKYNQINPDYGYLGGPLRPIGGKHYGYLISANNY